MAGFLALFVWGLCRFSADYGQCKYFDTMYQTIV